MDSLDRLKLLSSQMDLEPAEDASCPTPELQTSTERKKDVYLAEAVLPGGKRITLLKTLLTTACERNCNYCPFRAGRDYRRATFKPEELASTYMSLFRAGIAGGIFLSSGIVGGGVRTQDKLIESAEILRHKLGYTGYLHLKIMPGAQKAQVERSMQLADRVSINLEAPNDRRLELLAPRKTFLEELLQPLKWVEEIRRNQPSYLGWNHRWPSSVTQFVVGGAGENDLELLTTTTHLYKQLHLRRAYYSAFRPIPDTPLENLPPESKLREHRLYQSSFLIRDYGFDLEELPFDAAGKLPLASDPKLTWADQHLAHQPIELNRASREQLLRIPGIGLQGVEAILTNRRQSRLTDLSQLRKMGIHPERAAPYILLNGQRPVYQMQLW